MKGGAMDEIGRFLEADEAVAERPAARARCGDCRRLNRDLLADEAEPFERLGYWFCGVHGRAHIDPDGRQPNLNRRGGCDYSTKNRQMSLFDFN